MSMMLGVHVSPVKQLHINGKLVNKVFMHQRPLKEALIKRYQDETGYKQLRRTFVPNLEEDANLPEEDEKPGKCAATAAKHIGGLLYIVRGSSPLLAYVVGRLGRRTKSWRVFDDKSLHKIMCYVSTHLDEGVELSVEEEHVLHYHI